MTTTQLSLRNISVEADALADQLDDPTADNPLSVSLTVSQGTSALSNGTSPSTDALSIGAIDTITPADFLLAGSVSAFQSVAAASSPTFGPILSASAAESEIAFISGVTSAQKVAATSFETWNGNNPATYAASTSFANKWGSTTIGTSGGTVSYYFDTASNWTSAEKNAFVSSMALWSAEVNIQFSETVNSATSNFTIKRGVDHSAYWSGSVSGTSIGASTLGAHAASGLLSVDTTVPGFGPVGGSLNTFGGYAWQTIVHELGHAIGLGHGGAYNGSVTTATQQFSAYDTRLYSLMSYISPTDTTAKYYGTYAVAGTDWGTSTTTFNGSTYISGNVPTTPMMLDIAAAQRIYGAATSGPLSSGGQVFGFNTNIVGDVGKFFDFTQNTKPVVTLWDAGVNNTLDASGWSSNASIDLHPGAFSSAGGLVNNIGIALGTQINNAIGGTGNDTLVGNQWNNTLNGGAGTDTADYSYATTAFNASISNGNGTVSGGGDVGSDTLVSIERIIGGSGDDHLTATGGSETLDGGAGNDVLYFSSGTNVTGLGGAGSDYVYGGTSGGISILRGGSGLVDVLIASSDAASVNLIYGDGGGYDYFFAGSGTTIFYGAATSTSDVEVMNGSTGFSTMYGGIGTNYFYAGSGATTMQGGAGINIYVTAAAAQGDTVYGGSGANYVYGGNKGDVIYGGASTDVFVCGSGNDIIVGGSGVSYSWGGAGSDTFVLDVTNSGVMVIQDFGTGGTQDTVRLLNSGLTSFADVVAHEFYVPGTNTTIITPIAGHAIWLVGIGPDQLNASHFVFS